MLMIARAIEGGGGHLAAAAAASAFSCASTTSNSDLLCLEPPQAAQDLAPLGLPFPLITRRSRGI